MRSLTATYFIIVCQRKRRVKTSCRDSIQQEILTTLPILITCWMTVKIHSLIRFLIILEFSIKKRHITPGKILMNPKMRILSCHSTSTALWPASVMMNMSKLDYWQHSSPTEPMASIKYLWKRERNSDWITKILRQVKFANPISCTPSSAHLLPLLSRLWYSYTTASSIW